MSGRDGPAADDGLERRALRGERAAWDQLVERHRRQVLIALLADGMPLERAEELCQAAWTRLWAAHAEGQLLRLVLPGLAITQARFLARDGHRREAMAAALPASDLTVPGAEDAVASRQQLELVWAALAKLPAREQRLFRLAQHDGIPHAQLAERFGLSVQRVRQIIFEVRRHLRTVLRVA